jgi:hypothetical protein
LVAAERALPAPAEAPAAAPQPARNVTFALSRQVWDAARNKAHAEIERLKAAIKEVYTGDGNYATVVTGLVNLDDVLAKLDARLSGKLGEALKAAAPGERQRCLREAQTLLRQYKAYLTGNALALELDNNPFTPLVACKTLLTAVAMLEKKLV